MKPMTMTTKSRTRGATRANILMVMRVLEALGPDPLLLHAASAAYLAEAFPGERMIVTTRKKPFRRIPKAT